MTPDRPYDPAADGLASYHDALAVLRARAEGLPDHAFLAAPETPTPAGVAPATETPRGLPAGDFSGGAA